MNKNQLAAALPNATGFQFFPGQLEYLARVATKDSALVAADTGCGKTLFLVTLARLKCEAGGIFTGRALIVAPGGTLRRAKPEKDGEEEGEETETQTMSQWRQEIARFAPDVPVFELFTWDDYLRALQPDGTLPAGIYVTYYEAIFRNSSLEFLPDSWLERGPRGRREPRDKAHLNLCNHLGVSPGPTTRQFLLSNAGMLCWQTDAQLTANAAENGLPLVNPKSIVVGGTVVTYSSARGIERHEIKTIVEKSANNHAVGVGTENKGIRCVVTPCLAEAIESDQRWRSLRDSTDDAASILKRTTRFESCFNFVGLDEAHYCCNLDANLTKCLLRIQPRYRFAFTATPIPNIASNLFSLMGWLCVPDWFRGDGRLNLAWPYHVGELPRFEEQFLSQERDFTQELIDRESKRKAGKCVRRAATISSPARLLKIIKPTVAYISKAECNTAYQGPKLVDVRVPLGLQQARLYAHFLDRNNIPATNSLVRAAKQTAWLRGIAADPVTFCRDRFKKDFDQEAKSLRVTSEFSPKLIAVLELARDILGKGEQVVIVSARIGLNDIIQRRLTECGIPVARIDSTIAPSSHSSEANRFKQGKVPVMLMGQKCAASHSFPQCIYEIAVAIEWSWGPLHQARGRVDRVNSRPGVTIYCVLHKDSIEESQFDRCATKGDSATICLEGKRVPRDYHPVDPCEILAANYARWHHANGDIRDVGQGDQNAAAIQTLCELACEANWTTLRDELAMAGLGWIKGAALQSGVTPTISPRKRPSWIRMASLTAS